MMTKTNKIESEILNDPKKYAAIYVRISSQKDNNSLEAQTSEAKRVLTSKNLLLYAVYQDKVSGRTTSPPDRDGFGKLLEDAKAGCFKTIVAYKHDRIVRNLNDWINLKAQLRKLGIKIIFSDDTEYTSDNSLQGDFLENLIVMVAESEPNTINERVSNGKRLRREQGIYASGANIPFGYNREPVGDKCDSVGKSLYTIQPLKAIFIQHIFCEARDIFDKGSTKTEGIKQKILSYLDYLITSSSSRIILDIILEYAYTLKTRLVKKCEKEPFLQKIIEQLKVYLEVKSLEDIKKELESIRTHLNGAGNIDTILANSIYGSYMLIVANEVKMSITIEANVPKLNKDSFVKTQNVATIIDEKTFAKVHSYMLMPKILKEKELGFLLMGKLKCCKCNNHLHHFSNGILQCTKYDKTVDKNVVCTTFAINSVIEAVLDIIIDDAFKNSKDGFTNFCNTIKDKLSYLRNELQTLRNTKIFLLKEYLNSKDKSYKRVQSNQKEINSLLYKIATYANELSNINKLQDIINYYNNSIPENKKSNSVMARIKLSLISYILSNQEIFNSVFNKLIKEIKVKVIERKCDIKCEFAVNYEFLYKEPSRIPSCID